MADAPQCPLCNAKMKLRTGKRGQFYGCSKFPGCKGTRDAAPIVEVKDIKLAKGSPEQEAIWHWLETGTENGIIEALAGVGKAQPLTSKILTPNGWKLMGDICVGDAVIDPDGGIGFVEAVFPQGMKETFKVCFSDETFAYCCNEHLWLTQVVDDRTAHRQGTVKSLDEIRNTLKVRNGKRNNHYIPMVTPVEFYEKDLPVNPYLLGVLLGNGQLGLKHVLLATSDEYIVNRVISLLPEGCQLVERSPNNYAIIGSEWHINAILDAMRSFGLDGKLAADKFVPSKYLYSSKESRLALLHGLMDTDGATWNGHALEYTSVSIQLATAVQELVQSFGGKATFGIKEEPKYTYKGEICTGQKSYRVYISLPGNILPFSLPRKLNAFTPRTKYQPYRNISDVISVGEMECQCIKVSTKRNLYVTDNYVVTHNTYTIVNSVMRLRGVKIGIFSFNNHIIREMNEKLQKEGISWARGYTYNAFGFRAIKNCPQLQNAELFQDKLPTIITELFPEDNEESIIIRNATAKLVRLCKCYMEDGKNQDVLSDLTERFGVEINGDCGDYEEVEKRTKRIFDLVPQALDLCLKRKTTLDFDDQVWWTVNMKLPVEKFDICFVDEAQDTNKMQQKLLEMAC